MVEEAARDLCLASDVAHRGVLDAALLVERLGRRDDLGLAGLGHGRGLHGGPFFGAGRTC